MKQPKVHVFTRAYNAEATIRRTIESVLNQTYANWSYVIRDNGSTDRTYAICQEYADKDSRIILVRNEKNHVFESEEDMRAREIEYGVRFGSALGEKDFYSLLDADDEYMPDFFERAVNFAQENDLDIVAGGSRFFREGTEDILGHMTQPVDVLISGQDFSKLFPYYHWNLRQIWGKLFRRNTVLGLLEYLLDFRKKLGGTDLPYGGDTVSALYSFQKARRVGLLSGCCHRYYIQKKSVSSTLQPNRVDSDWILHQATEQFLMEKCGFISEENRRVLATVYANSLKDTLMIIAKSNLAVENKLCEIRRMVEHPVTRENAQYDIPENTEIRKLFFAVVREGIRLKSKDVQESVSAIIKELAPICAPAISSVCLPLFESKPELLSAVQADDRKAMLKVLLEILRANVQCNKADLCTMVQALSADKPRLKDLCDQRFLEHYSDIYLALWEERYDEALDEMTGLLLNGEKANDAYLQIYLSLAALENQPDAFVFGKLCMAKLKFCQGEKSECIALLNELSEMGIEDNEDIVTMKKDLQM